MYFIVTSAPADARMCSARLDVGGIDRSPLQPQNVCVDEGVSSSPSPFSPPVLFSMFLLLFPFPASPAFLFPALTGLLSWMSLPSFCGRDSPNGFAKIRRRVKLSPIKEATLPLSQERSKKDRAPRLRIASATRGAVFMGLPTRRCRPCEFSNDRSEGLDLHGGKTHPRRSMSQNARSCAEVSLVRGRAAGQRFVFIRQWTSAEIKTYAALAIMRKARTPAMIWAVRDVFFILFLLC